MWNEPCTRCDLIGMGITPYPPTGPAEIWLSCGHFDSFSMCLTAELLLGAEREHVLHWPKLTHTHIQTQFNCTLLVSMAMSFFCPLLYLLKAKTYLHPWCKGGRLNVCFVSNDRRIQGHATSVDCDACWLKYVHNELDGSGFDSAFDVTRLLSVSALPWPCGKRSWG